MQGNQDINARSLFSAVRERGFVSDADLNRHMNALGNPDRLQAVADVLADLEKRNMVERVAGRWRAKITKRSVYLVIESAGIVDRDALVDLFDAQGERNVCFSRVVSAVRALEDEKVILILDGAPPRYAIAPRLEADRLSN